MRQILIRAGNVAIRARLRDSETADKIYAALPVYAAAKTWGDEVYFDVPVSCPAEVEARAVVEAGEIAYWPEGEAIAIGFGPTPISNGDEIRLASPCNIWADAQDDVRQLKAVPVGARITVLAADS